LLIKWDAIKLEKLAYIDDAAELTRQILCAKDAFEQEKEHVFVIGLDLDRQIKYVDLVAVGTLDSCSMHPREVFRRAVNMMASSIILVPSVADLKATFRCMAAGKILGIPVEASLIVSTKTNEFTELPKRMPLEFENLEP
jgi:DNA repair protein RadC